MQPAVIVAGHPVHSRLPGLPTGDELLAMHAGRVQPPQMLSVGALSQRLPLRLIHERISEPLRAAWKSPHQYWPPLSLWNISPGAGRRRHLAHGQGIPDQADLPVLLQAPAQHLAAEQVDSRRQVQPALVVGNVRVSPHQGRLGASGLRRHCNRSAPPAGGVLAVGRHHEFALALGSDAALHKLAHPVSLPTRMPLASHSSCMRGQPHPP